MREREEDDLRTFLALLTIASLASAGIRFGGRVGYYDGDDPRTGQDAGSAVFGGQIQIPFMDLVRLELSGTYAGSESDITMQTYLVNYIDEEYGYDYEGDSLGLIGYLEDEWGWSPDSITQELLGEYTATFHDINLGATLKVLIPVASLPVRPYVGGGGGAHILFSDADVLMQAVNRETGGSISMDPYDHVHPGLHAVAGLAFEPPMVPVSVFGEYRYTKPLGSEGDLSGANMFYTGVNVGF